MTTFAELKARHIESLEDELAFKEAALRYCRHSKKQAKLVRQVRELKGLIAWMKGEITFAELEKIEGTNH
jgi:hypothetical protein